MSVLCGDTSAPGVQEPTTECASVVYGVCGEFEVNHNYGIIVVWKKFERN